MLCLGLPIMLFLLPIMLVLCSNMNNINVKILLLECSIRVFAIQEWVCLILSTFQCILNVLLECINTAQCILYALIVLLESIDLILAHYAGIISHWKLSIVTYTHIHTQLIIII